MIMIKVLAFCAALLAPESSGLDPHGRSLHLKLYTDYNTSYEACITTVRQAHKYGVDPFVLTAVMYDVTGMSPGRATKTRAARRTLKAHGCDGQGQFIKSSCSVFMLAPPYFASLLAQTTQQQGGGGSFTDYRKALCRFYAGDQKCKKKDRQKAKLIANIARRYVDVYSRTHTSFMWRSPFTQPPNEEEMYNLEVQRNYRDRQDGMATSCTSGDPTLDHLINQLGYASRCNSANYRHRMNQGITIISSVLGQNIHLEASAVTSPSGILRSEYLLHMSYTQLKTRLSYASTLRTNNLVIANITETEGRDFIVNLHAYSSQARLEFYRQANHTYTVGIYWY